MAKPTEQVRVGSRSRTTGEERQQRWPAGAGAGRQRCRMKYEQESGRRESEGAPGSLPAWPSHMSELHRCPSPAWGSRDSQSLCVTWERRLGGCRAHSPG